MQHRLIQSVGIAWTILFAAFIVWVYATEPRNLKEVTAGVQAATFGYEANQARFDLGLTLFRLRQYHAARVEWGLADEGKHDPLTQFYIAYAFYREGWHITNPDADLYQNGLEAVNLAIELARDQPLTVNDPELGMHTAAELKTELELGAKTTVIPPLIRVVRPFK